MSKKFHAQRDGYVKLLHEKSAADPAKELFWTLVMDAAGRRVGATVSSVEVEALISERCLWSVINPQAASAHWRVLVDEGYLRVNGETQSPNQAKPISTYRVVKLFSTSESIAAARERDRQSLERHRALRGPRPSLTGRRPLP